MSRPVITLIAWVAVVLAGLCCRGVSKHDDHALPSNAYARKQPDTLVFMDSSCTAYLRADVPINCEDAKRTAKAAGYWTQNHWLYPPEIRLISSLSRRIWEVRSTLVSHSRTGACKTSNGCKVLETKIIGLDAITGAVVYKRQDKKEIPVYE